MRRLFGIGLLFLFANAAGFWLMDENEDVEPPHPLRVTQYLKAIPTTLVGDPAFRAMVGSSVALVVASSLIPFYTLHAIRDLSASERQVSLLAGLAISALQASGNGSLLTAQVNVAADAVSGMRGVRLRSVDRW